LKNRLSSDVAKDHSLHLQDSAILRRRKSSFDEESENHPGNPHQSRNLCQNLSESLLLHRFNLYIVPQSYRKSLLIIDISTMVSREHVHQHLLHPRLQVHLPLYHRLVRKIWRLRFADVVCAMVKTFTKKMSYMSVIERYVRLTLHLHRHKFAKNWICRLLVVDQCQRTKAVKETIGETLDVSFVVICGPNWQRI